MCGIAGYISEIKDKHIVEKIVKLMIDNVLWRGPDDKGVYIDRRNAIVVGMVHCRLSILDLSDRGKQPMVSPDGNYVISYNGEVYNYKEIRKDLKNKGHAFVSDCDTEVVLHACMEWGVMGAVSKFNGMWAFALYDKTKAEITLARDRMGVKPLYYSALNNGEFIFSSDIRSMYSVPSLSKEIDREALHGYLWNMYIPAPYTIFKNIKKLEPGSLLKYNIETQKLKADKYWNVFEIKTDSNRTYGEYLSELKKILRNAVKIRLEADVPVGLFLSGGIDSSLVASLAQEQSEKGINTYSIGFGEKENDDAKVAMEVAKRLGTNHEELYCSPRDALDLIEKIPIAYAEPFADNSQIPTMLLCKLAREHVTVSLTGDGGDELFTGYPYYLACDKLYKKRCLAKIGRMTIGHLVDHIVPIYNYFRWKTDKFCNAADMAGILQLDYITAHGILDSILPLSKMKGRDISRDMNDFCFENNYQSNNMGMIRASVLQSIQYSLPDDMLVKVDRASMFYSLECRSPILDYRVAEWSLSAPEGYNLHNGQLKAPLKEILYKYVPRAVVERSKSGFGVPINLWVHNELNEIINDSLSTDFIRRQGIFDVNGMQKFLSAFNRGKNPILDRVAYTLLMFQLWWQEYFD